VAQVVPDAGGGPRRGRIWKGLAIHLSLIETPSLIRFSCKN
jgi:hypothetical protein